MKKVITISFFLSVIIPSFAQSDEVKTLEHRIENTSNDTLRMVMLDSLSFIFSEINSDSSYYYAEKGILICRKLNYRLNEAFAMQNMGYAFLNMGNHPKALQTLLSALEIAEDPKNEKKIPPPKYRTGFGMESSDISPRIYRLQVQAWIHLNLGIIYENTGNTEKELFHYSLSLKLAEQTGNQQSIGIASLNLGRLYLALKKPDSAFAFVNRAYEISIKRGYEKYLGSVLLNMGRVHLALGNKEKAIVFIKQAIVTSKEQDYYRGVVAGNLLLSDINFQRGDMDSAFYFVNNAHQFAAQLNAPDLLLRCYNSLTSLYKSVNKTDSIAKYQGLIIQIKDSLFNSKQAQQFRNIDFDAEQQKKEIEAAKKDYRNRMQKYALLIGLAVFVITAIILLRNNRNKQKAYTLLEKQKQETDFQKTKVEQALEDLKATQAQLVQQEKMASLGELTAGIAHEIQNPLNFVNNFSEVNNELIEELKSQKPDLKTEEIDAILTSIFENNEKISHHGKRADSIVKGMLQHSRANSGQKEPTDINVLADEYLRLAYHGMRAKDKTFNATTRTEFDNGIGKIKVMPQDIGRVILNLINNAFYAVNEKQKQNLKGYEPTVTLTTVKQKDKIEITIKDNGNGIPQKIADKIFQPFFTTKPAGEGTGLGLSLSYDIIKVNGGEIKVKTKEGEGSEFIIVLPI